MKYRMLQSARAKSLVWDRSNINEIVVSLIVWTSSFYFAKDDVIATDSTALLASENTTDA